jgi:hypothetical protein
LRIHAAQIETKERAEEAVVKMQADNPGVEFRVVKL